MIQNPVLRGLVAPGAGLYSTLMRCRAALYRREILRSVKVSPRVISIGNLTVGGTGKTPFTLRLAELLRDRGHGVAVLCRGYKRESGEPITLVSDGKTVLADVRKSGDEAQLMARRLTNVAVVAGSPKWRAAQWVEKNLSPQWLLVDDGFQHLKLHRDWNILLLDADRPFDNGRVIPLGRLREPPTVIRRADVIVLVPGGGAASPSASTLQEIRALNSSAEIFEARHEFSAISTLDGSDSKNQIESLRQKKLLAFCGIARPEQFFSALKEQKLNLGGVLSFPDHYRYQRPDIRKILDAASQSGAEALITTAKDAVHLERRAFGNWPCYVFEIKMSISEEDRLVKMLLGKG